MVASIKGWLAARKQYRKSKRFDPSCRNHGNCPRCEGDRKHQGKRNEPADLKDQLQDLCAGI